MSKSFGKARPTKAALVNSFNNANLGFYEKTEILIIGSDGKKTQQIGPSIKNLDKVDREK